ncbi:MAG: DUF4143 domain-containing protein, partial [Proteobacteria bacterium]|nr:DUF4143 domain-containing protein [Pseudomonadota bacterium]
ILQSRTSSPKIIIPAPALTTLATGFNRVNDPSERGFLFENSVGAELLRTFPDQTYYWRQGNDEVDFVIHRDEGPIGLEVKSGRRKSTHGLDRFREKFKGAKTLIVTPENFETFCKDSKAMLSHAL